MSEPHPIGVPAADVGFRRAAGLACIAPLKAAGVLGRASPVNWPPPPWKCATRELPRRVQDTCGPRGARIRYWARSLPERQVSDLLAAITLLRQQPGTGPVAVYGQGYTAPLAVYAAILDPQITEVVVAACLASHADPTTPEFPECSAWGTCPKTWLDLSAYDYLCWKDARHVHLDPAAL